MRGSVSGSRAGGAGRSQRESTAAEENCPAGGRQGDAAWGPPSAQLGEGKSSGAGGLDQAGNSGVIARSRVKVRVEATGRQQR